MKEIESEIQNEVKIFYEINIEIKKSNSKLMKTMFWKEVDETLGRIGRKLETTKLENTNKLK